MNEEYKNQLFRLAAVLYADNNYEVAPKTIHRKIIESVLLECGAKQYSTHQIIDFIQKNYDITFDEDDIKDIVQNPKEEGFHTNHRNGELFVSLTEKRKQALNNKISNKTIDFFIEQFQKENSQIVARINSKEVIYKFLYDVFSTNTLSFQKLIDHQKDISGLITLDSSKYSPKEKDLINNFLQWDNFEKNKAIFDISSYALEYCMLTNKNGGSSIHLSNLKNKNFYLDSNIIYRSLGINGENRQKRSRTFLKKFSDSGEKLIISKITDIEFKDSIKYYADKIRKFDEPRIQSSVYEEFVVQKEIFDFYHKWRIGKYNTNLDLFVSEIFSTYDSFLSEFKIEIDIKTPYDSKEKGIDETIKDFASSISTFKSQEGNDYTGSAFVDAENILWIEKKRDNKNQNIFETKYFFISTDQGLRRWDYQRNSTTPIVLLPSQWMSILLRYLDRTSDDYKSFVNFLNLRNNEVLIEGERLHIVLAGISQMTESIEQQRFLLKNLVENKFNGVITKGANDEQIFENAKKYAKSELEKQVEELKLRNEELSSKHESLSVEFKGKTDDVMSEVQKIKEDASDRERKLKETLGENEALKIALMQREIKDEILKWQRPAYWLIIVGLIIIAFTLLQFIFKTWEYNYPFKIIKWIDTIQYSVSRNTLTVLMYTPLIGLWLIAVYVWEHLGPSERKEKKNEEIKNMFNEKYK